MNVHWRPPDEVHPVLPPEQDFLAFDEESEADVGGVYLMTHSGGRPVVLDHVRL